MESYIFDTEIYPNYFLITFLNIETQEFRHFEFFEDNKNKGGRQDTTALVAFLGKIKVLAGYNSRQYDNDMILAFLKSPIVAGTKRFSDELIGGKRQHNPFTKSLSTRLGLAGLLKLEFLDFDLFSILGSRVSLKILECHLN